MIHPHLERVPGCSTGLADPKETSLVLFIISTTDNQRFSGPIFLPIPEKKKNMTPRSDPLTWGGGDDRDAMAAWVAKLVNITPISLGLIRGIQLYKDSQSGLQTNWYLAGFPTLSEPHCQKESLIVIGNLSCT